MSGHSKRLHSPCSASSAYRWLACPGSVGLSNELPPEPTSKYAAEGTRAHELAEILLKRVIEKKLGPDGCLEIPQRFPEDMRDHVLSYVNMVKEIIESFTEPPAIRLESRLYLEKDIGLFGTADVAMTGKHGCKYVGIVVDLKYGKIPVSAYENPQLAYYAAAMRRTSKKKLERIDVMIIQPRAEEVLAQTSYTNPELDVWEKKLVSGAEKALTQVFKKSEREFNVGDHCKWCVARYVCKARNPSAPEGAGSEFMEEKE